MQKIVAMSLNVETEEISPQESVEQFALPWTNSEGLGIRPGDVPEHGYARIGTSLLQQSRQERKVVVLHKNDRMPHIANFTRDGVRESNVHALIVVPV